ncbi:hypothetical protein [Fischerella sp. PCC 9605]|uniref:hypothetical protein n=1 Tax=Fischerella sp. PCC 9605 TaxID=1173024 RepID=UPI000479B0CC|nr:hypothetical protein [Fischerella sp. PCC 9605]
MPRPKKEAGSLTGSKHFKKSKSPSDIIAETAGNTISKLGNAANTVSRAASGLSQFTSNAVNNSNGSSANSGNSSNSITNSGIPLASSVPHGVTIPQFDLNNAIGSNLYSAESSIPETETSEASKQRQIVARQNNSLDIALDVIKRNRKAVKLAIEIEGFQGDAVDLYTQKINTGQKVVKSQIAFTNLKVEQSKLEQTQELLVQQENATTGTKNLTEPKREEWDLKQQLQVATNESLKVDIQKAQKRKEEKLAALETYLLLPEG